MQSITNVLRLKNEFDNECDNQNSEGLSMLSDDEDDETVNDALKTATSWSHIYLDFRLHPHRPLRDFGARNS